MASKDTTRYYSDLHEKSVCRALDARQTSNSGANRFEKGDVIQDDASLLIECKTTMTDRASISIKKEWIEKNKEEAFRNRLSNSCLAINFGPSSPNYYVISEGLMELLVEKLIEETL